MSAWSLRASLGPRERSANRVQKRGERSNPPGMAASSGDLEAVSSSLWTTKEALRQPWTVQERASQYTRHVPQNQHLCGSADTRSGYYPHYYPHCLLAAGGRRRTALDGAGWRAERASAHRPRRCAADAAAAEAARCARSPARLRHQRAASHGAPLRWAFRWGLRYRWPVDKGSRVNGSQHRPYGTVRTRRKPRRSRRESGV